MIGLKQTLKHQLISLQISHDSSYFFRDKTSGAAYSFVKHGVINRPFSARCCLAKPKSTILNDIGCRDSSTYIIFRGWRSRWTKVDRHRSETIENTRRVSLPIELRCNCSTVLMITCMIFALSRSDSDFSCRILSKSSPPRINSVTMNTVGAL